MERRARRLGEYYRILGVDKRRADSLRNFLDDRITHILYYFPFSPESTSQIPIVNFSFSGPLKIQGFRKEIAPDALELIIDTILISKSHFEGSFRFGPSKRDFERREKLIGRVDYQVVQFPIELEGQRKYLVTKELKRYQKEKVSASYFAITRESALSASQ